MSFMIIVGFWKILGVYFIFYIHVIFCISGLTIVQLLCCQIFEKSKGVILIEE